MKYFLVTLLVVFSATHAQSQTTKPTTDGCLQYGGTRHTILKPLGRVFKIKTIVGANSGTAREADYVEFKTLENIYSTGNPSKVLFDKDTPIFGVVSHREGRRFLLKRGRIEIKLDPWVNWNGERVEMAIFRRGPVKTNQKEEMTRAQNQMTQ